MSATATIDQFEMMLNDPRLQSADPSIMDEIRAFKAATVEHGGLLAMNQVAAIANVSHSTISRHVKAGRFTTYDIAGMKLLPLDEVMAYLKVRNEELLSKGGRGLKAPKFRDLIPNE